MKKINLTAMVVIVTVVAIGTGYTIGYTTGTIDTQGYTIEVHKSKTYDTKEYLVPYEDQNGKVYWFTEDEAENWDILELDNNGNIRNYWDYVIINDVEICRTKKCTPLWHETQNFTEIRFEDW